MNCFRLVEATCTSYCTSDTGLIKSERKRNGDKLFAGLFQSTVSMSDSPLRETWSAETESLAKATS